MKKMNLLFAIGALLALFIAVGCEDTVASSNRDTILVNSYDDLKNCNEENKGLTAIVDSTNSMYFCNGKNWVEMASKDTVYIKSDTAVIYDTLVKIDSVRTIEKDTIYNIDSLVKIQRDTVYNVDTLVNVQRDTIYSFDTLVVKDTLLVINKDTVYISTSNSCKLEKYGDFSTLKCGIDGSIEVPVRNMACKIVEENLSPYFSERLVLYCTHSSGNTFAVEIYDEKCGGVHYSSYSYFCYNNRIFNKCNGKEYKPYEEFCWDYDGNIYPRCGRKEYIPPAQKCVNGEVVSRFSSP